jgi:aryl-alcohol dehydrogenase-like predicted oxidoreductase
MVQAGAEQSSEKEEVVRAQIADALLRFAFHDPHVDHLIVGIRKQEWIVRNLESIDRGPLTGDEHKKLMDLWAMIKSDK